MNNKFKIGQFVMVTNGYGKCDGKHYINIKGKVIEKDNYFFDYLIEFSDKSTDWIDEKYLRNIRKYTKRSNGK